MNKFILLLATIFFMASVTAISTDIKENYSPGETMIIQISGNILSNIEKENIELRRGHVQVPFEYDVGKIGEFYFLYGILPNFENNYTLIIRDIQTTVNGQPTIIDHYENFSTQGQTVLYSINPGFLSTNTDADFTLTLNSDLNENIEISLPEPITYTLRPGTNNLKISESDLTPGFSTLNIGMYTIPIYYTSNQENQDNDSENNTSTDPSENYNFVFFPKTIESTLLEGNKQSYPIRIANFGNERVSNIEIIYDKDIFISSIEEIEFIDSDDYVEFNLTLKTTDEQIDEIITARLGNYEVDLPIVVSYTQEESEVQTPYLDDYQDTPPSSTYLCAELNGVFCSASEACSGDTVQAYDGNNCCLGSCQSPESESRSFAWIGYLIGAVILVVAVIIIGRYLKTKKLSAPKKAVP